MKFYTLYLLNFMVHTIWKCHISILWNMFGNVLYRQFGPRITISVSCNSLVWWNLFTFGLALIAFLQSLLSFYIGIGFFVGLGFSFVILIGSGTISRYFKARFLIISGTSLKWTVMRESGGSWVKVDVPWNWTVCESGQPRYGVYPIIKQKVWARDLSCEWICMKTLL